MGQGKRRDAALEARWREVLVRQSKSGLNIRGFCQREAVSQASFYAWRRTIQSRDAAAAGHPTTLTPAFVPLVVHAKEPIQPSGQFSIELRGGRVLHLPLSLPPAEVARIIHAIESDAQEAA